MQSNIMYSSEDIIELTKKLKQHQNNNIAINTRSFGKTLAYLVDYGFINWLISVPGKYTGWKLKNIND